jgi:serine/threonine protein kinase
MKIEPEEEEEEDDFDPKELRLRLDRNVFNYYRMSNMLGSGSFGEVWKAVQRETGSHRAIKVIKKADIRNKL